MTKEEAIKYLQQLYPNGGHCWLDEQRIEAVGMAVKALQEEPVSEEFEKALAKEWQGYVDRGAATVDALEDNTQELAFAKGFYRGSKWKEELFEKNRLKHCDSITKEQAELEQGFIDQHLDKHQRMPTFLDAIEYGMSLKEKEIQSIIELAEDHAMLAGMEKMKEQMMKDAIKCEITWMDGFMLDYTQEQQDDLLEKIGAKVGDKVKLVIIKEVKNEKK